MKDNTSLAMDASNGMFAYHLIGVMTAAHELGMITPDPEAEALSYLQTFHAEEATAWGVFEREEAKENNEQHLTNPSH
jgi:hypothetical protein